MLFSAIRNVFLSRTDERATRIETSFLGSKDFSRNAVLNSKLILNKTNNETFAQNVIASKDLTAIDALLKSKTLHQSNRHLLEAYRYFLGKVGSEVASRGTKSDDFIEPLIDTLRTRLMIITITVTSDEDANLFFESLNARGKELAISDLVKNYLYFETGNQVDRAEQLWEQMEGDLGRRPLPEFIRHYWIAKKVEADSPAVREKHLYRMIHQSVTNRKEALALINDLRTSATDYARISDYDLWPDDPAYDDEAFSRAISNLRLFRVTQSNPVLLNSIQKFSKPQDIAKTFRLVANFAFRYFIIGNQSSGNFERIAATIAYEIRSNNYTSPTHVADALRAANPDAAFRGDFALATFPKSKSKLARYTLSEINDFMAKNSGRGGQVVDRDPKHVDLEHVLPQSIPEAWKSFFSQNSDPEEYVYRVGNLTLLRAKKNRGLEDNPFGEKKPILLGSQFPINDFFSTVSGWGDKEIEQRQDKLAKTAVEVWRLS